MSAAQELAERGFEVEVFESKPAWGGKARSLLVPGTGKDGRQDLPGEHGFRFFPSFYKHLPDTMKRIPFGSNLNGVFDNLVQAGRDWEEEFTNQPPRRRRVKLEAETPAQPAPTPAPAPSPTRPAPSASRST